MISEIGAAAAALAGTLTGGRYVVKVATRPATGEYRKFDSAIEISMEADNDIEKLFLATKKIFRDKKIKLANCISSWHTDFSL